jgi:hypothetical protein
MGPPDLPSVSTQRKGVYRKLLLLGTVVGAISFLGPAYAETWDFATPVVQFQPGCVLGCNSFTYTGTGGTTIVASGHEEVSGFPFPVDLVTRFPSVADEMGLGLLNDPFEFEITPGSWISLDVSKIPESLRTLGLSFAGDSTTDGEQWKVYGSPNATDMPGSGPTTLLGECTAGSPNTCEFPNIAILAGTTDNFLEVTSGSGNVLLRELDTVPLPDALLLFGTGLAGLGFVSRRRRMRWPAWRRLRTHRNARR